MDTSNIEISTVILQRSPDKPQASSHISPVRNICQSPEKNSSPTTALVSTRKRISSIESSPETVPARKLLFSVAKTDDGANALDTVDSKPKPSGGTNQVRGVLAGEHSAVVFAPIGAGGCSYPGHRAPGRLGRELATTSRHIVFPNSSMRLLDGSFRFASDEEIGIIKMLFPLAFCFRQFGTILVIVFVALPRKPWPLTIGEMPVYFTTDMKKLPFPDGIYGTKGKALQDRRIKMYTTPTDEQMDRIFEYFDIELHIRIESVVWLGMKFHITVPPGTRRHDVPETVLGLICTYGFPDPVSRKEAALRTVQHTRRLRDDSNYCRSLRPGVVLSCGNSGNNELLTSSGVPVKRDGEHFVTVASHGFPLGEEDVWHPTASGSIIGEVKANLGTSEISLMELRPCYTYGTETFGTPQAPPVVLKKFRHHSTMSYGGSVYLDSPFSGRSDGVFIGYERRLDPRALTSSEQFPDPEDRFLSINWLYVENGYQDALEGTCGSAIWDAEGNVIGFFRFADENGIALATSPAVLMRHGWEIMAIGNS